MLDNFDSLQTSPNHFLPGKQKNDQWSQVEADIYIYTYWIQNPKFCGLKTNYRVFLRNSKKTWLFLKNLVISHILVLWWFMMIYDSFSIFQQHHVWFHWGFVVLYEVDSASICAPSDERKHLINGNQNHKQILFDMTPR